MIWDRAIFDLNALPEATFLGSYVGVGKMPSSKPEICIMGRSNSGKSSLLGALLKNSNQVKTSSRPGSTSTLNVFDYGRIYLTDLPGFGFARRSISQKFVLSEMHGAYIQKRMNLKAAFLTMDCRRSPESEELQLAAWFRERRMPLIIAYTKADKLNQKELAELKTNCISRETDYHAQVLTSATERKGLAYLVNFIDSLV